MERPSTLNIQTLSGEYCDKDIIILHACFQLLTDFVGGKEAFTSHVDWEHDETHKKAKYEIEQFTQCALPGSFTATNPSIGHSWVNSKLTLSITLI